MTADIIKLVVRGPLWPALLADLHDFDVRTDADGFTLIEGTLTDQAQLLGLLDMFDGLHIRVVSLNRLRTSAEEGPGS